MWSPYQFECRIRTVRAFLYYGQHENETQKFFRVSEAKKKKKKKIKCHFYNAQVRVKSTKVKMFTRNVPFM